MVTKAEKDAAAAAAANAETTESAAPALVETEAVRDLAAENAKRKAEAERKLDAGERDPAVLEAIAFRDANGHLPDGWVQDGAAFYEAAKAE